MGVCSYSPGLEAVDKQEHIVLDLSDEYQCDQRCKGATTGIACERTGMFQAPVSIVSTSDDDGGRTPSMENGAS